MRVAKIFQLFSGCADGHKRFSAAAFEKPENAETALKGGYASTQDKYAIYPIPQSTVYPAESLCWEQMYRW